MLFFGHFNLKLTSPYIVLIFLLRLHIINVINKIIHQIANIESSKFSSDKTNTFGRIISPMTVPKLLNKSRGNTNQFLAFFRR